MRRKRKIRLALRQELMFGPLCGKCKMLIDGGDPYYQRYGYCRKCMEELNLIDKKDDSDGREKRRY